MLLTGMRPGEVRALTREAVDLEGRTISVKRQVTGPTKTRKHREVELTEELAVILREWITDHAFQQSEFLFFPDLTTNLRSDRTAAARVKRCFVKVLRRTVLPGHHTPHCLRHTYASLMLQDGAPIQYVSRQLGHASISITADIYGRWLPMKDTKHGRMDGLLNPQRSGIPATVSAMRG